MKKLTILTLALAPIFVHAAVLSELQESAVNERSPQIGLPTNVVNSIGTTSLPTKVVNSVGTTSLPTNVLSTSNIVSTPLLPSRTAAWKQAQEEQALRNQLSSGSNTGLNTGLSQVAQAQRGNAAVKAQADQMLRDYAASFQRGSTPSNTLTLPSVNSSGGVTGNTNIRYIAPQEQILGYPSAAPILSSGQVLVQHEPVHAANDLASMTYRDPQAVNPITVGFGEGQTRPGAYDAMTMLFGGDWYRKTALSIGGQSSDPWNQQISIWMKQYESLNPSDLSALAAWRNSVNNVLSGNAKGDVTPLDANNRVIGGTTLNTKTVEQIEPVAQRWVPPTKEEAEAAIQSSPFYSSMAKTKPVRETTSTGLSSWVR